eukprot:7258217-Prymnesium_polylepis.1
MACPAVARRPRATQRERTRHERRSTREPSFINEHSACIFNELEIAQHPKRTAPNGSAVCSSRPAVPPSTNGA